MIKSLDISNFQSHERSHLDFAPGVNVLVGSSDSGKTAILRALNWVIANRPAGDAFRSDWGGDTQVSVIIDDKRITRFKSSKENVYNIDIAVPGEPDESLEFKALGQSVPDEIAKAFNLHDVNVQYQMDSPFLLSSDWSPGRVAEYLNEVAGLDDIDRSTANINATLRRLGASLEAETARLGDVKTRHAALDYVDEFEKKLIRVETAYVTATRSRSDEQELNNLVTDIKSLQDKLVVQPDYGSAATRLLAIEKTREAAGRLQTTRDSIADCIGAIRKTEVAIAAVKKTTRAERLLNHITELASSLDKVNEERLRLEGLLGGVYELGEIIEHRKNVTHKLEAEWKRVAPDVCPMCAGTGRLK